MNRDSNQPKFRNNLPQLNGDIFLTDGGAETTYIFHGGFNLPEFAAFDLLNQEGGPEMLKSYFSPYLEIAKTNKTGYILESATWRASKDWGKKIGYSQKELIEINHKAIEILVEVREENKNEIKHLVISGCIGPQDDGYNPSTFMTIEEAKAYHQIQIDTLADTQADMVSAYTITYAEEAIGIVNAAKSAKMPVMISFTVETDGNLPSGQSLKDAITQVDNVTENGAVYYMINCAHPTHFENILQPGARWNSRIFGVRANASKLSHAELDEAKELDAGNPVEFGYDYKRLKKKLPNLSIIGGCCGTDHQHVENAIHSI